jgi:predicted Rossmann-fold nucleotide-binding protein
MKQKVLDYCDHEFAYEKMISAWDQTMCRVIEDFKSSIA